MGLRKLENIGPWNIVQMAMSMRNPKGTTPPHTLWCSNDVNKYMRNKLMFYLRDKLLHNIRCVLFLIILSAHLYIINTFRTWLIHNNIKMFNDILYNHNIIKSMTSTISLAHQIRERITKIKQTTITLTYRYFVRESQRRTINEAKWRTKYTKPAFTHSILNYMKYISG